MQVTKNKNLNTLMDIRGTISSKQANAMLRYIKTI